MNYQLYAGDPVSTTTGAALYQEIAVLDSATDYDPTKGPEEQESWARHAEALSQISGPINESGEMQSGWSYDPLAISSVWVVVGPWWVIRFPWIRINP